LALVGRADALVARAGDAVVARRHLRRDAAALDAREPAVAEDAVVGAALVALAVAAAVARLAAVHRAAAVARSVAVVARASGEQEETHNPRNCMSAHRRALRRDSTGQYSSSSEHLRGCDAAFVTPVRRRALRRMGAASSASARASRRRSPR